MFFIFKAQVQQMLPLVVNWQNFRQKKENFVFAKKNGNMSEQFGKFNNFFSISNFVEIYSAMISENFTLQNQAFRSPFPMASLINQQNGPIPLPGRNTLCQQINRFQGMYFQRQMFIVNQLYGHLADNSFQMSQLSEKVDGLDHYLSLLNQELMNISQEKPKTTSEMINKNFDEDVQDEMNLKKTGRIHYKTLFRDKIFGVKDYKYKLNIQGSLPSIFYKERNICFKIKLLNNKGEIIPNQNALSLNLKVFYSNGEEIGPTHKGQNFIKGTTNTLLMHGRASFDKLYPREVSRKLDRRKMVFVIYASSMGKQTDQNSFQVRPEEIQPFILYGVKVITKQQKSKLLKKPIDEKKNSDSDWELEEKI